MAEILIGFVSKHGQTRKIAQHLEAELMHLGHRCVVHDLQQISPGEKLDRFHSVIAGAPIYRSHYPKAFRKWLKANQSVLTQKITAFYTVCLGVLQTSDEHVQENLNGIMSELFAEVGWRPKLTKIFAGALNYTEYFWPLRWVMKRISASAGGSTDTSRDHEYTDWDDVRRFAREIDATIRHTEDAFHAKTGT